MSFHIRSLYLHSERRCGAKHKFPKDYLFSLKDTICEGADKNVSVLNVDHLPHTQEIYLETVSSTIAWFENTPGLLTDQYLLEKA